MTSTTQLVSGLDVSEHPAAQAWRELGRGHRRPVAVELRKERKKSAVYRLLGAGPRGSTVVAKYCNAETGEVERLIYEEILPHLDLGALRCYGSLVRRDGARWLFLEDAGEGRFSADKLEHRRLTARWLARMHLRAADLPEIERLPDRGSAHYLEQLRQGRKRITRGIRNPALTREQASFLRQLAARYGELETAWPALETVCSPLAPTLVHRDFLRSNVRFRDDPGGTRVLVLDWEMAGRGIPAVDVSRVDLRTYLDEVRAVWTLDADAAEWLSGVGEVLRSLDAIEWLAPDLEQPWAGWRIDQIRLPAERLDEALGVLGLVRRSGE
jgi:hypothetical protein